MTKKYGYGIDLAQSLNYTGIVVTEIAEKKIRLTTVRKLQKLTYPEVQEILFELFERFPPRYIAVDYTNERAFAHTIEAKFSPSFMNSHSNDYQKWKVVEPITFTPETKLQLKQNAREIFEKKQFAFPNRLRTDPRMWSIIEELQQQMLREFASPGNNGQFKFPKPEGHDNDLIIALELNLHGAKKFLYYQPNNSFISRPANPMEKYTCNPCKEGKHVGQPHFIHYDLTGGLIGCPCGTCKELMYRPAQISRQVP